VDKDVRKPQKFQAGADMDRKPVLVDIPVQYNLIENATSLWLH
jgi:hypothetical protein